MSFLSRTQEQHLVQSRVTAAADQTGTAEALRLATRQLNAAIAAAVEAGMTVELSRTHRCHGSACWGDQVSATIGKASR